MDSQHLLLSLWLIVTCQLLLSGLFCPALAAVSRLYWNASNPLFKPSGSNRMVLHFHDKLTVICPTSSDETYLVVWTHEIESMQRCLSTEGTYTLADCIKNPAPTHQVMKFPAIPGSPSFHKPIYVFSSSTGSRSGYSNTEGGACSDRNMRLEIHATRATISSSTTSSTSTSTSSTSTSTSSGSSSSSTTRQQWTSTVRQTTSSKKVQWPTPQDLERPAGNLIVAASAKSPSACLLLALTAVCCLLTAC